MSANIYRLADAEEWARRNFLKIDHSVVERSEEHNEEESVKVVPFIGFEDFCEEVLDLKLHEPVLIRKKKKKRKRKEPKIKEEDEDQKAILLHSLNAQNLQKLGNSSRLIRELTDRERLRGMDRPTARQLLQDKLMFRGDTDLSAIKIRRFCIGTVSDDIFQSDDFSMPQFVAITVMENSKFSGVLQLYLDYSLDAAVSTRETIGKKKVKTIKWNPLNSKDVALVCTTVQYIVNRSMDSMILVPAVSSTTFISWLRVLNQLRAAHSTRSSVAISLSRVMCIEDFVWSIQELNEIHLEHEPIHDVINPMEAGQKSCHWLIQAFNACSEAVERPQNQDSYANMDALKCQNVNFNVSQEPNSNSGHVSAVHQQFPSPFERNAHEYYQPEDAAVKNKVNTWLEKNNLDAVVDEDADCATDSSL